MAAQRKKKQEYLKSEELFRRKAYLIITEMVELSIQTREDTSVLVDEILHSIFFLGRIHKPPISPEIILKDDDEAENLLSTLMSCYPRPFELYSSQLPRRSPFSCVLDMTVLLVGQENEEEIKDRLQDFIDTVEEDVPSNHLISSTICVSQKYNNSVRYYGVSMSTSGRNAGKIMVAASCFGAWDDYVADAVMTYYPDKEKSKKEYFDGTIKIPDYVRCQAFNLKSGGKMNPCKSCGNLFGLSTDEETEWPYGNCAEVESLSNLLKNENEVKEQSQPRSPTWTPENRETARESVLQDLGAVLHTIQFETWDGEHFYDPLAG
ncbi:uncharacterized protein LOC103367411 [Stegastes partitus]|uniref:Uncharacterized protein LOC103367411 n=1 Tax=Stegastes partitus TaxID=144197 RepID=A0A9Y4NA27_9TELE|nr:PREDICTED: uncharacterized protein LOC103367411 [Stegastes partitus]